MLRLPVVRDSQWQLLECPPASEGNWTPIASWFRLRLTRDSLIVAVNDAPNQSQCHVRLPFADLAGKKWRLQDQLNPASYERNGDDLQSRGLYLDMDPWKASVFSLTKYNQSELDREESVTGLPVKLRLRRRTPLAARRGLQRSPAA